MDTAIFSTALGDFGIGWTAAGIRRLLLPGDQPDRLRERLGGTPADPPAQIAAAIAVIQRYAEGAPVDFSDLPLDLAGVPAFHAKVYALLLEIGRGETTTYGDLARRLGDVGLARAVGQAMGANPIPLIIPCHRVLAAGGGLGGFSAPGGGDSKRRMLLLEGARTSAAPTSQLAFGF